MSVSMSVFHRALVAGKITLYVNGGEKFHDSSAARSFTTPSVASITIPIAGPHLVHSLTFQFHSSHVVPEG